MLCGESIREELLLGYPDEIFQAGSQYSQAGRLSFDSESSVLMTEAMHVFGRRYFVLGWLLFAVALGIGIFVGWLIWG